MKPTILVDHRIPVTARERLKRIGDLIMVDSKQIVYNAISGHPDIFFCKTGDQLIIAPNTPVKLVESLQTRNINILMGNKSLGPAYPETAYYNAVVTPEFIIHNIRLTDQAIIDACSHLDIIHVNQSYSRCNLLSLKDRRFICSDKGIEKALLAKGFDVLFIDPVDILLPGFNHGFFGGCAGVYRDKVFFIGKLETHPREKAIKSFLSGYEIVELYDGKLFDGGGILFLD